MKKVLITGANGYIGRHLVRWLQPHYLIYTLDVNDRGGLRIDYPVDIRRSFRVGMTFDHVVHLAAFVSVPDSVEQPGLCFQTNITGTMNVLKRVKARNFVLASTVGAASPVNPYALSKKAAENVVAAARGAENYTIFRFSNVIGMGNDMEPLAFKHDGIMTALLNARAYGVFNIYGCDYNTLDGSAVRDYIHVNEACAAIASALLDPAKGVETIGSGKGYSVRQLVREFQTVTGAAFRVEHHPRREGDVERSVVTVPSRYYRQMYSIRELVKF